MTGPRTDELAERVRAVLGEAEVVRDPGRPVTRLGLALDPAPGLTAWAEREGLDALFLHRSWGFEPPPGVGVLAAHDGFDDALGLHGRAVAEALGARDHERLGPKLAVAQIPAGLAALPGRARALFGPGVELRAGAAPPGGDRVALASALRPELVREAAQRGAGLYVSGTWRPSAADALADTGLSLLLVGHRPAEAWALHHLASRLRGWAAGPAVVVAEPRPGQPRA